MLRLVAATSFPFTLVADLSRTARTRVASSLLSSRSPARSPLRPKSITDHAEHLADAHSPSYRAPSQRCGTKFCHLISSREYGDLLTPLTAEGVRVLSSFLPSSAPSLNAGRLGLRVSSVTTGLAHYRLVDSRTTRLLPFSSTISMLIHLARRIIINALVTCRVPAFLSLWPTRSPMTLLAPRRFACLCRRARAERRFARRRADCAQGAGCDCALGVITCAKAFAVRRSIPRRRSREDPARRAEKACRLP